MEVICIAEEICLFLLSEVRISWMLRSHQLKENLGEADEFGPGPSSLAKGLP